MRVVSGLVNRRLDKVNRRLDKVNRRLDKVNRRLDKRPLKTYMPVVD